MKARRLVSLLCGFVFVFSGALVYAGGQNGESPAGTDKEKVIAEMTSYVTQHRDDDPLMEVEPGVWVKTSNVKGINIDGETYYYSLAPHMSYDPVSRGEMSEEDVNVVYWDDDPEVSLLIYKLN